MEVLVDDVMMVFVAGSEVIVYVVRLEPPLPLGAVHETVAVVELEEMLAVTDVGASGVV